MKTAVKPCGRQRGKWVCTVDAVWVAEIVQPPLHLFQRVHIVAVSAGDCIKTFIRYDDFVPVVNKQMLVKDARNRLRVREAVERIHAADVRDLQCGESMRHVVELAGAQQFYPKRLIQLVEEFENPVGACPGAAQLLDNNWGGVVAVGEGGLHCLHLLALGAQVVFHRVELRDVGGGEQYPLFGIV